MDDGEVPIDLRILLTDAKLSQEDYVTAEILGLELKDLIDANFLKPLNEFEEGASKRISVIQREIKALGFLVVQKLVIVISKDPLEMKLDSEIILYHSVQTTETPTN